ncbi:MAG: RecX family transcriptional regulator [Alphaproteobacteria bacterium]|nr:RecX family transcriptional regulator [Alphaproteobacteria bacterium]
MVNSENPDGKVGQNRRRTPKKATPERLERAALHYLERFASSSENLRRVLMRRVARSAQFHAAEAGPDEDRAGAASVDEIIQRFLRAGLLDDRAYAEARAASLHRRGASLRAIRMKLAQKGVDAETAEAALETLRRTLAEDADPGADPDFQAALNYARRRRLGPFRSKDRADHRDRDLAALGRQGFSYDIARQIIEAENATSLLE